ncbi:MAG: hypothetical protein ACP5N2_03800 [Candidatus Nanoarchaeia archaeon]
MVKDKWLMVRMSKDQMVNLRAVALAAGFRKVSEYVRTRIFEDIK